MNYVKVDVGLVLSVEYQSRPLEEGVLHLGLLAYCAKSETGGLIRHAKKFRNADWKLIHTRMTKGKIAKLIRADLASWEGDDLFVHWYDFDAERRFGRKHPDSNKERREAQEFELPRYHVKKKPPSTQASTQVAFAFAEPSPNEQVIHRVIHRSEVENYTPQDPAENHRPRSKSSAESILAEGGDLNDNAALGDRQYRTIIREERSATQSGRAVFPESGSEATFGTLADSPAPEHSELFSASVPECPDALESGTPLDWLLGDFSPNLPNHQDGPGAVFAAGEHPSPMSTEKCQPAPEYGPSRRSGRRTRDADPTGSVPEPKKEPSREAFWVTDKLHDAIVSHAPGFRWLPQARIAWARDLDLAIRRDGRDPERLAELAAYAHSDPSAWYAHGILSGKKLRDLYDEIEIKMRADAERRAKRGRFAEGTNPGTRLRGPTSLDYFAAADAIAAARARQGDS